MIRITEYNTEKRHCEAGSAEAIQNIVVKPIIKKGKTNDTNN